MSAAELIERSHAGVVCPPEDPQALADAVSRLARLLADELEAMGRAGRAFYDAELAMQVGVDRFEEILMEVASAARGGSRRR